MLERRRAPARAGVVDEDVEPAELGDGAPDDLLGLAGVADVPAEAERPDAEPSGELRGCLLAPLCPAAAEHEVGAELGERLRELQPEPARAAGDQGDLAGEVEQGADVHGRLGSPG